MSRGVEDKHAIAVVVGLAPRAGATTVARTLALGLAAQASGVAVVVGGAAPPRPGVATPVTARLARAASAVAGFPAAAAGRLVLLPAPAVEAPIVARLAALAPVVVDGGRSAPDPALLAAATMIAVVAGAGADPSLVDAAAAALVSSRGPAPVVVMNRCGERSGEMDARASVATPPAPLGARLARRGLRGGGRLAGPLAAAIDGPADPA